MTITDLTPIFALARARTDEWSDKATERTLAAFAAVVAGAETDWEPEESWGTVLHAQHAIAFVSVLFPLCLFDATYGHALAPVASTMALISIPCQTLNAPRFRIERALLEDIWGVPMRDVIDLEEMSAQDLWYLTVSARPN